MATEAIPEISILTRTESKPNIDNHCEKGISTPIIARCTTAPPRMQSDDTTAPPELSKVKVPEKFFIMKSLTLQDLESGLVLGQLSYTMSPSLDALSARQKTFA